MAIGRIDGTRARGGGLATALLIAALLAAASLIGGGAGRPAGAQPPASFDFGDAPASYPVLMLDDGARHALSASPLLGTLVDTEADGQPGPATGDDDNGSDDEDGVTFPTAFVPGAAGRATVDANSAGVLDAWIDWNGDGDWGDAGEQVATSLAVAAGTNEVIFSVPATATPGTVYARFRISSGGGLGPTGAAPDGEVEDYAATVVEPATVIVVKDDVGDTGTSFDITVRQLMTVVDTGQISDIGVSTTTTSASVDPALPFEIEEAATAMFFVDADASSCVNQTNTTLTVLKTVDGGALTLRAEAAEVNPGDVITCTIVNLPAIDLIIAKADSGLTGTPFDVEIRQDMAVVASGVISATDVQLVPLGAMVDPSKVFEIVEAAKPGFSVDPDESLCEDGSNNLLAFTKSVDNGALTLRSDPNVTQPGEQIVCTIVNWVNVDLVVTKDDAADTGTPFDVAVHQGGTTIGSGVIADGPGTSGDATAQFSLNPLLDVVIEETLAGGFVAGAAPTCTTSGNKSIGTLSGSGSASIEFSISATELEHGDTVTCVFNNQPSATPDPSATSTPVPTSTPTATPTGTPTATPTAAPTATSVAVPAGAPSRPVFEPTTLPILPAPQPAITDAAGAATGSDPLAFTGSESQGYLTLGLVLLGSGAAAAAVGRRARRND